MKIKNINLNYFILISAILILGCLDPVPIYTPSSSNNYNSSSSNNSSSVNSNSFEKVFLVENGIGVTVNGPVQINVVRFAQEADVQPSQVYGIVGWTKEVVNFNNAGTYILPLDLSQDKESTSYRVVLVNHSDGQKYEIYGTIHNNKFSK